MIINFFNCKNIDGKKYLVKDMVLECWTKDHFIWTLALGAPGLIFIIIVPIFGIIFLFIKRKKSDQYNFQIYYLQLYQGLRQKALYWEFVNTLRKLILVVLLIMIPYYYVLIQPLFAFITVFIFWRLQRKL